MEQEQKQEDQGTEMPVLDREQISEFVCSWCDLSSRRDSAVDKLAEAISGITSALSLLSPGSLRQLRDQIDEKLESIETKDEEIAKNLEFNKKALTEKIVIKDE